MLETSDKLEPCLGINFVAESFHDLVDVIESATKLNIDYRIHLKYSIWRQGTKIRQICVTIKTMTVTYRSCKWEILSLRIKI